MTAIIVKLFEKPQKEMKAPAFLSVLFKMWPLFIFYKKYKPIDVSSDYEFDFVARVSNVIRPGICHKIRAAVDLMGLKCDDDVRCFRIEPYGRWGNQLWSLRRAIMLAKAVGIPEIRMNPGHAMFTKRVRYQDIDLIPDLTSRNENCILWNTFIPVPAAQVVNLTFEDSFKSLVVDQMDHIVRNLSENLLAIHIRSGDTFQTETETTLDYAQPPCSYYREIIESRNWSDVWLFAEDNMNPCVDYVKGLGAKLQDVSFKGVIASMMGARNMVFGKGTLGVALAGLAYNLDRVYTFNMSTGQIHAKEHYNCVPDPKYYKFVVRMWKRADYQLRMMKTSKCEYWENITYDPGPRNVFIHDDFL